MTFKSVTDKSRRDDESKDWGRSNHSMEGKVAIHGLNAKQQVTVAWRTDSSQRPKVGFGRSPALQSWLSNFKIWQR